MCGRCRLFFGLLFFFSPSKTVIHSQNTKEIFSQIFLNLNPPILHVPTSEPTHLYWWEGSRGGVGGVLKGVFDFFQHTPSNMNILGLYTIGEMAAILIFGHFQRGNKLRFFVGSTKMAIKNSKICQFSQVMAQIKAKRYSYENLAVWSAKNVFYRVFRPKCPKKYNSYNLKLGPKAQNKWPQIL